jgi:hypothetical protein
MRTGHTLNAVYKITNVPVLENTTLLAISISTECVAYMDRLPYVRLMGFSWAHGDHDLMMMVIPDSAGDAS